MPTARRGKSQSRFALAVACAIVGALLAGCASSGGSLMRAGSATERGTAIAAASETRERVYGARHAVPVVTAQASPVEQAPVKDKAADKTAGKTLDPRGAPARKSGGPSVVEVQPGETLLGIAKQHRISVAELMSLNKLSSITVTPGQKLTIPKR